MKSSAIEILNRLRASANKPVEPFASPHEVDIPPHPKALEIKDLLENSYYDGKEWFDGRKEPERLNLLKAKWIAEQAEIWRREEYEALADIQNEIIDDDEWLKLGRSE